MFKKIVLDNGLRIITAPMHGTNTVTVLVLCGTGSDYESKNINGISHFLEHMFFKGTTRRPDPQTIAYELASIGSISNAFTSHELTGYYIKAGKNYLSNSLDILADIYKNSLLREEEIEREKQVIIEEIHKDHDIPTTHIWRVWEHMLYGDQPAGWDISGSEDLIRSMKRDDFANYFHNQYVALNTAVVVAGNFNELEVVERIRDLFSDIRTTPPIRKKPAVVEEQFGPVVGIEHRKTDQTHLVLGFRGYDVNHPNRYAAEILGTILGGGMFSRMFNEIREKLGLAYWVSTEHESYSNRGFLVTYAGVDHKNVEKTISTALGEYRKIAYELVQPLELQRVKDYIRGTTLIALEASNAVANFVGMEEMITGRPMTADEIFAKIDEVTPDQISTVAKDIIQPQRLNLTMIGPWEDKKQFEKLLQNL